MFIAALFTIARTWKPSKCPLTDEWLENMWYMDTLEYYSTIKRNEIESFVEIWMDLQTIIQSEVSQKEKKYINAYVWNLEKWYRWSYLQDRNRDTDIENKYMDTVGWERGWDWHIYTIDNMYRIGT